MKSILTVIVTLGLAMGAYAGCGKTETDKGKLKAVNGKQITIEVDGKDVTRTLTPQSTGADDVSKLEGKKVTVVSSHGKVTSIEKS